MVKVVSPILTKNKLADIQDSQMRILKLRRRRWLKRCDRIKNVLISLYTGEHVRIFTENFSQLNF